MTARSAPTATVSSSPTRISCRTPATGDGISVSTLSVETSSSGSSTSTVSPTLFSQRVTVPSVTLLPEGRHGHAFRHVAEVSFVVSGVTAVRWPGGPGLASGVGVQRLAGQGQVRLAERLVLGGVGVDQLRDVLGAGPPS